jgi:probable F420-dependent oxidoreductase
VKLGVVFPQTEIGSDPKVVRRYAESVEAAGFDHLVVYDHVLGASPDRPGWSGPYTIADPFHEVMVLFGYLAAVTSRIELVTEVLVLPQRQTALVAKQAAEVDLLSGGRLRVGVGIGWNAAEYEALGMSFRDRGRRIEEQVSILRRLWSEREVTLRESAHAFDRVGLNPLPGRRIPIWIGATADIGLRRAARIADGWQSELGLGPELEANLARLRGYLTEYGRDSTTFGVAGEVGVARDGAAESLAAVAGWQALGATHVSLTTMGYGYAGADDHLAALVAVKRAWDQTPGPGALA